jgi:hypothetical protein
MISMSGVFDEKRIQLAGLIAYTPYNPVGREKGELQLPPPVFLT